MTASTTNLGLTTYNTITDASSLVNTYINTVSGSSNSNLTKIDSYVGNTSASVTSMSTACLVLLETSTSFPNGRILTAGTGVSITNSSASREVALRL